MGAGTSGEKRVFAGVFRESGAAQALWINVDDENLNAKRAELLVGQKKKKKKLGVPHFGKAPEV